MTSYRDDYKQAARHFYWTLPRGIVAAFVAFGAVWLLLVAVTPLTIGFGWARGEASLRSFGHVRATYAEAFDDTAAMDANVRQSCTLKQAVAAATAAGDTSTVNQRESQLIAIENNYNRIKAEYEAYMSDHFRGGVIRPTQLPLPYPTIEARQARLCG